MAQPLKILVVEDDSQAALYLSMYLELRGYAVKAVSDFETATQQLQESAFDVLLSDLCLNDRDAWELPSKAASPLFAISMSGLCNPEDIRRSAASGFKAHLAKPFAPRELDAILEKLQTETAS